MSLLSRLTLMPVVWRLALAGAAVGAVAFGIVGVGRSLSFFDPKADMAYFYVAGTCLTHRTSPYDPASFAAANPGIEDMRNDAYFYPPQFGTIAWLLALLPFLAAKILFVVINVVVLLFLIALCARPPKVPTDLGVPDPAPEARWLIPAIILGNPFTAHVLWMGQTSLIAVGALAGGWVYAKRGQVWPGGLLIGLSTIKPQFALFACLWLLLEGRWKVLLIGTATALLLSAPTMIVCGPVGAFTEWLGSASRYHALAANAVGFRHVFSLQNFLAAMGLKLPTLFPVGVAAAAGLWWFRSRLVPSDVLALLVGVSLVFGFSHDYDLSALALLIPAFWTHLRGREKAALLAVGLMLLLFVPQRLFHSLKNDLLLQFRFPVVLGLLGWLLALSLKRTSKGPAPVADLGPAAG
ncbi:MAG: DUF2029 domain-containing protein [Planctomycetota bacterium]|nr:MAG: DUF2029 domain-containing protein [Planctomycetota bacterium]